MLVQFVRALIVILILFAASRESLAARLGLEFQVNSYATGAQFAPSVANLSAGGFVVIWVSDGQDGSSYGIYGQRYSATGSSVGIEFPVNTHTAEAQTRPSVASLSNGGFVVTWTSFGQDGSSDGIYGRRFSATGIPLDNPPVLINSHTVDAQNMSSVTSLVGGGRAGPANLDRSISGFSA